MTFCIFWLLTYVGQVLDLETRPVSVTHGRNQQDSHREVNARKYQNEQSTIGGNLLHLKTYPYERSHRNDMSIYEERQPIYSWTPDDVLVDEIINEPNDLEATIMAFSPHLSNTVYPKYLAVTSPYVTVSSTTTEPLVDDDLLAQHSFPRQHQQLQRQHHYHHEQLQQRLRQRRQLQRNKKRRIIDYSNNKQQHHQQQQVESQALELPISIYYNGEKILPDRRQSDQVDVYEQRFNSPIKLKTEPILEHVSKQSPSSSSSSSSSLSSISSSAIPSSSSSSSSSTSSSLSSASSSSSSSSSALSSSREFFHAGGFSPLKPFIYEINDPSKKKNWITIGRRSVNLPEESSVSQQALVPHTSPFTSEGTSVNTQLVRSIRASRPYDVPQIECPASEEGMERFACPKPDRMGRYRCIDDHVLCDGFLDCPGGEDEDMLHCMFFKTTRAHLDVLADAILRWARGR